MRNVSTVQQRIGSNEAAGTQYMAEPQTLYHLGVGSIVEQSAAAR
jgi:hypothetical protein